MNRYKTAATLLLFGVGIGLMPASRADDAITWLEHFYNDRNICVSNTSVAAIEPSDASLTVFIEAENDYIQRLQLGGGERLVYDWLAVHCPLPLEAYGAVLKGRDVVVVAGGTYELSCKQLGK